jgi:dihydrofolate synthase/folylpolyglutamate synthase
MSDRTNSSTRRDAALRFLLARIDYERTQSMPRSEEAFKLDRMRELLGRMGNPQEGMPIVHVAGTKGKGSTSAMIAAVLSAAGYRTGLFTSPHLDRVEERIAIDGQPCSADELADLIERIRPVVEAMDCGSSRLPVASGQCEPPGPNPQSPIPTPTAEPGLTYFEIVTAMAFDHFRRRGVDAAVLEVGLGGRLDSTNVCSPAVTIITSISFDHTKQLGDTLAAIATEKAGIIKPGVPVISGVQSDEPRDVIRRIARQNGCRLVELGVDFDFVYHPPHRLEQAASSAKFDFQYLHSTCTHEERAETSRGLTAPGEFRGHSDENSRGPTARGEPANTHRELLAPGYCDVALSLLGRHQAANAAVALAAIEELRRSNWTIPEIAIRRGLAEVAPPARVEVVARRPTVVLDAAHNVASIAALVEVLEESFSANRRLLIFATTQEKDQRGMLQQLLGHFNHVIFTRYSNNPRSVSPEELLGLAKSIGWGGSSTATPTIEIVATPAEAWDAVRRMATPDDLICITGSFFLASEMRTQIAERPFSPQ